MYAERIAADFEVTVPYVFAVSTVVLVCAVALIVRELARARQGETRQRAHRGRRKALGLPSLDLDASTDEDESTHVLSRAETLFASEGGELGAPVRISAGGWSRTGLHRRHNEDRLLLADGDGLFVVADGMGGHGNGRLASKLAVDAMREVLCGSAVPDMVERDELTMTGKALVGAIDAANRAIYQTAKRERRLAGMGATVVAARFSSRARRAYIGYVGDSRCYRLRDGALTLLTRDHTFEALGIRGPMASHLRRALGTRRSVVVDVTVDVPRPGDLYLLCSDGLSKELSSEELRNALCMVEGEVADKARMLVRRVREGGGRDDATALLIQVGSG